MAVHADMPYLMRHRLARNFNNPRPKRKIRFNQQATL